jgi:5-methylthioadenosine/S-adenosylhomocysteine deaminase
MYDLIVNNAVILSSHTRYRPFVGAVAVENGRIAFAGPGRFPASDAETCVDADGMILMPGLVNAHCHGDMAFAKGMGDAMTLGEQIERFREGNWFFDATDADDRYTARLHTYIEALLSGTTCIMENMYWSLADRSQEAVERIGIRAALAEDIRYDFSRPDELLPPGALTHFAERCAAGGIVPALGFPAEEDFTESLLSRAVELTRTLSCRVTCHLAETTWRIEAANRQMGTRPVRALDRFGIVNENFIASHGVWLDREDIDLLALRGASVVNTPLCELKIADGLAPIPELIEAKVNVALGTDGAMWNNSNDLFRDRTCIALAHNLKRGPRALDHRDVLDMATINGARALGLADEIGSIEVGKQADFILIDARAPHMGPIRLGGNENVSSSVVYCATGQDVRDVFIAGRQLVRDRRLPHVDVARVQRDLRAISDRLFA